MVLKIRIAYSGHAWEHYFIQLSLLQLSVCVGCRLFFLLLIFASIQIVHVFKKAISNCRKYNNNNGDYITNRFDCMSFFHFGLCNTICKIIVLIAIPYISAYIFKEYYKRERYTNHSSSIEM